MLSLGHLAIPPIGGSTRWLGIAYRTMDCTVCITYTCRLDCASEDVKMKMSIAHDMENSIICFIFTNCPVEIDFI